MTSDASTSIATKAKTGATQRDDTRCPAKPDASIADHTRSRLSPNDRGSASIMAICQAVTAG